MKKQTTALISIIFLITSATALNAQIDQNSPDDVVLKSSNSYEVTKNYSSSSSSGDIKSREWNLLGTSQTDSGLSGQFTFSRDNGVSASNTIRLTVSDGNSSKVDEVTQVVHDVPNASISSGSTTEGETKSVKTGKTVSFSSSVTDTFDNSLTYTWKVGVDDKGSGDSFSTSFGDPGTYEVKLKVKDSAGYSTTTNAITVDVSSSNNNNGGSSGSSSGGGGLPLSTGNKSDKGKEKASNKSDKGASVNVTGEGKNKTISVQSKNGVANVTIQKTGDTKQINVQINPASDDEAVRGVSISSEAKGEVSVNVRHLGDKKPEKVPEPAAENVYTYQEINSSINDTEIDAVEVDFRVKKSWLDEKNGTKEEVVMKRYNEGWEELETRYINSSSEFHNFEASSEGFSYYAVTLEETSDQITGDQNLEGNQTDRDSRQDQVTRPPYFYIVLGVLILGGILLFYYSRE